MTASQMDILAGIITDRYIPEGSTYYEWISEYELHRKRLSEYNEERSNVQEEREG